MTMKLLVFHLGLALLAVGLSGCGRADGLHAVTGSVTFQGRPIESGDIIFRTVDGSGGSAASKIVNGHYALRATSGVKRVEINAMRKIETAQAASGEPAFSFEAYIPEKYNQNSELTAEVSSRGRNTFDFDLVP